MGDHSLPEDLHPVLRRVYLARGIRSAQDMDRSLHRLPAPGLLAGMDAMVARLSRAIMEQKRILIVADYDADGATACAVALLGLRAMGARNVDFIVPDRFRYGYGLTAPLVETAMAWRPQVLLTVDNGIASHEGVAAAKARQMEVLITDHHLPGKQLPDADAIVNPNLPGCDFPSRALAGVGVMFYVLTGLRSNLRQLGWFHRLGRDEPNLGTLLDLVALGTVADVVPLDTVNRILVHQGLQRMRGGKARPGIASLIAVAGRQPERLAAGDLGFALGPRLNAAGRLDDMSMGIRCLLAADPARAHSLALELDALNRERREIESQMQEDAHRILETGCWDQATAGGLCLFDDSWHEGVIGILAARIKDRLARPVIAFAQGKDGLLKGSARSVPGLHIRDLIAEVDARQPGLVVRYGGHAMAAGLTLAREDLERFDELFCECSPKHLARLDPDCKIYSDGTLQGDDYSFELAEALRLGGPWGQAFPEPRFHGEYQVTDSRIVGEKHLKMTLHSPDLPRPVDAIAFAPDNLPVLRACSHLKLAYRLEINEFRGRRQLQLNADYLEPIP